MTKPGTDPAVLEGMVIVDPTGKSHTVKNGEIIAFTAALGVWKLIEKGGKAVASSKVELDQKAANLYGGGPVENPIVCKPGSVIDVPGTFDGNAQNSKLTGARVLSEGKKSCVMVVDPGTKAGKGEIGVQDGSYSAKVPCNFVSIAVSGPTEIVLGKAGLMKIRLKGLGGLTAAQKEFLGKTLAIRWRNSTTKVVSFGSEDTGFKMVDFAAVVGDTFEMTLPFQSVGPGQYVITAWATNPPLMGSLPYCQGFQCCSTACAPCSSSWGFCDDTGMTNCSRIGGPSGTHCAACLGGVCNHIGSSACGHWWCACPFGFCVC